MRKTNAILKRDGIGIDRKVLEAFKLFTSTANLTIGSFTATFANLTSGKTIRSSGNTLKINGSVLSFTLKADSAKLFGTPVPKTGSKIVPVTYNGNAFTETISFTTMGATTTFK